jgi:hypothetical protein
MFDLPEEGPPRPNRAARRRSQPQEEKQFVNQMMYLLTAPHLAWPGWEDLLQRHKAEITKQRLVHHREIFENQMCTEFEAMLYLSTASMANPISHDWVETYGWLFRRWNPEAGQDSWGEARDPGLAPGQVEQLNRLRRWIYRQQVNRLKARQRDADRKEVEEERKRLEAEQLRMFELPEGE